MKKVLFVCTGNTCRSPMAMGIFNNMASNITGSEQPGFGFTAISAGLSAWAGDPPSANAVLAMQKLFKIDITAHRARLLSHSDMEEAFLVLGMTMSHKQYILQQFPEACDKVFSLKEYAYGTAADIQTDIQNKDPGTISKQQLDIPDPYGGSLQHYIACAREIEQAVAALVEKLKKI